MRKKATRLLISTVVIGIVQRWIVSDLVIRPGLVNNIITFLSIVFGFYITSLSIFVTSRYVSSLYGLIDRQDKAKTLLHTLLDNYKFGLALTLMSIIYFLILYIGIDQETTGHFSLSDPLLFPFLGLMTNNFLYSFSMLDDLIRVVLQEAKNLKLR